MIAKSGSEASEIDYKAEMRKIRKDIVDFHGEMVLLINYSNVNYTGKCISFSFPINMQNFSIWGFSFLFE